MLPATSQENDWILVGNTTSKGKIKEKMGQRKDLRKKTSNQAISAQSRLNVHVNNALATSMALRESPIKDSADARNELTHRVHVAAEFLKETPFWKGFVTTLENQFGNLCNKHFFGHLIVLGIGSFSTQPPALLQVAMAVLLLRTYIRKDESGFEDNFGGSLVSLPPTKAIIYDPVFSHLEWSVCRELGFEQASNLKGKYILPCTGQPSLALLPHCPYSLYSNLVWANWERLEQVVFIGNSFEGYILRSLPNLPTIPSPQEILQPLKVDVVQEMFGLISEQSRADPKTCSKPLDGASDPDPGVDMRAAKARSDTVKTESDALSAALALPVDCIALVASAAKEVPLHKSEYFKIPGTSRPLQGLLASHMECAFNDISLVWFPISEVKRLSARPSESALDLWNLEHCPEMS